MQPSCVTINDQDIVIPRAARIVIKDHVTHWQPERARMGTIAIVSIYAGRARIRRSHDIGNNGNANQRNLKHII